MILSYYMNRIDINITKIKHRSTRLQLQGAYDELFNPESPAYCPDEKKLHRRLMYMHNEICKLVDAQEGELE
jgi:hypothetical protein